MVDLDVRQVNDCVLYWYFITYKILAIIAGSRKCGLSMLKKTLITPGCLD